MAEEPAYIRNLRALTRAEPQWADLDNIEAELYSPSNDRATAVMFGSFVEATLEHFLMTRMRPGSKSLLGFEGVLGTFGSKIKVAYAFKFIGPITRAHLDLIKLIRNEFAHSRMHFSFETAEVKAVCDKLNLVDRPDVIVPPRYLRIAPKVDKSRDKTHPRTRFICACHEISYRLSAGAFYPQEGDRVFPDSEGPLP
jgi:hypothetical protein